LGAIGKWNGDIVAYTTTATTLTAEIQSILEEDSTEFVAELPNIINRAEDRCQRELDLEIFQTESTGTLTQSSRTLARPSTMLDISEVSITIATVETPLEPRSQSFCNLYAPVPATEGAPKYYSEKDITNLEVVPTPDAAYAYTLRGVQREPKLVITTNETNWLTDFVGDLLLDACLVEAERYLLAPEQEATWEKAYQQKLQAYIDNFRGMRRADYAPTRASIGSGGIA
jgi:hypothetical protein